jgi:hypothetical protein
VLLFVENKMKQPSKIPNPFVNMNGADDTYIYPNVVALETLIEAHAWLEQVIDWRIFKQEEEKKSGNSIS